MKHITPAIWLLAAFFANVSSASDTTTSLTNHDKTDVITVGSPMKRFDRLKPGTHLYLRYKIGKDGSRATMDIWRRTVTFERRDGQELLHISQRWDGVVPPAYTLLQESWFERGAFRPLTHEREVTRDGKTVKRSYRFFNDHIVLGPDPSVQGASETIMPSREPAYNFETDMELSSRPCLLHGATRLA